MAQTLTLETTVISAGDSSDGGDSVCPCGHPSSGRSTSAVRRGRDRGLATRRTRDDAG